MNVRQYGGNEPVAFLAYACVVNATNTVDQIAVIRTRLPYTDTRALSEAWFSAFHLASGNAYGSMNSKISLRMEQSSFVAQAKNRKPKAKEYALKDPHRRELPKDTNGPVGEAREDEALETRRSGRVCARRNSSAPRPKEETEIFHAQCTLATADARFTLHMRQTGEKTIVIAICSVRHVETVRRVLAEAALSMRSRGERIEASVQAFDARVCA